MKVLKRKYGLWTGLALSLGVLVGCGSDDAVAPKEEEQQASEVKEEVEVQEEPKEEVKEESKEQEGKESTAGDKAAGSTDVENAVKPKDALDPKKPVPFGEYLETTIYSVDTEKYHTAYVKITKVTNETDDAAYVQKAIDENNAEGADFQQFNKADLNMPSDVELNILDYEVIIPEDFPPSEFGVSRIEMSFSAGNVDGGGVPSADGTSSYIGLGGTRNLLLTGDSDKQYQPGNVYQARSYFAMVKGFEDYTFELGVSPADTDGAEGMEFAHLAHK